MCTNTVYLLFNLHVLFNFFFIFKSFTQNQTEKKTNKLNNNKKKFTTKYRRYDNDNDGKDVVLMLNITLG